MSEADEIWTPEMREALIKDLEAEKAKRDLVRQNQIMLELLQDLAVILPTALHSGHQDLIERVKAVVEK